MRPDDLSGGAARVAHRSTPLVTRLAGRDCRSGTSTALVIGRPKAVTGDDPCCARVRRSVSGFRAILGCGSATLASLVFEDAPSPQAPSSGSSTVGSGDVSNAGGRGVSRPASWWLPARRRIAAAGRVCIVPGCGFGDLSFSAVRVVQGHRCRRSLLRQSRRRFEFQPRRRALTLRPAAAGDALLAEASR